MIPAFRPLTRHQAVEKHELAVHSAVKSSGDTIAMKG